MLKAEEELTEMLQKKYEISEEDAKKIALMISQLQLGYVLTLYPKKEFSEIMQDADKLFDISCNFYDMQKNTYNFISRDMNYNVLLDGKGNSVRQVITLDELVPIFLKICPHKELTLTMDFDWQDL